MYSKTYQSPTVPLRIVLKPNMHYGRQDTASSDARTSFDHSSKHRETCGGGTYNESCRGEIDFSMQGLLHSVVQEQDHIRKEAVQKLIHQFETPPNKEARPEAKSHIHSIQRAVEGNDLRHGKHGALRDLRDHSQNTVPQMFDILDERHCILHLRNMFATFRQDSKTKQRSLRCFVDSQLRHQEGPTGHVTGTERGKGSTMQPMSHLKRHRKKEYKSILD